MDIEDLFNEQPDEQPLVIPEFGPCSTMESEGGEEEEKKASAQKCCNESLACTKLQQPTPPQKEESKSSMSKSLCFKCKKAPATLTNKQDKVCRECFMDILVHRFKSSLRQNLKIWKDDLNLICISGGSNSMALLNMLHYSLFGNQSNRKMFFSVHILYIEESSAVYSCSDEQRAGNIKFIADTCERYKFTYTVLPIEGVFDVADIDMRVADASTLQHLAEEKKKDELQHSTPAPGLESVTN